MGASHKRAGVLFAKQFQQKRGYPLPAEITCRGDEFCE
jgi:hypothetical protein